MITVDKAAILDRDGIPCFLERPARHHDIIRFMVDKGCQKPINGEQGFMLSDGRSARRKPAAYIAIRAKQITREKMVAYPNLFSEDLW